jgi:hypothetical protein
MGSRKLFQALKQPTEALVYSQQGEGFKTLSFFHWILNPGGKLDGWACFYGSS